jgi:hypothetical protein
LKPFETGASSQGAPDYCFCSDTLAKMIVPTKAGGEFGIHPALSPGKSTGFSVPAKCARPKHSPIG